MWHLGLPLDYLIELCDEGGRYARSAGAYWQIGTPAWCGRMDEVFNALANAFGAQLPWCTACACSDSQPGRGRLPARTAQTSRKTSNVTPDVPSARRNRSTLPTHQVYGPRDRYRRLYADFCHRHLCRCHGCSEPSGFRVGSGHYPANAFVLIGADLAMRDWLHVRIKPAAMGALIASTGLLTYLLIRQPARSRLPRRSLSLPPHWLTG